MMLVMSVSCIVNVRQRNVRGENIRRGIVLLARAGFHKESVANSQLLRCRWRRIILLNGWSDLDASTVGKIFWGRLFHVPVISWGE